MKTTKNTTTILCSTGGDQYGEHWTFKLSKEAQNLGRKLSKNSEWGSGNVNSFEFRTDPTLIKVFRTIGWRIAKNSSKPSFWTRGAKLRTYEYENRFLNFDLSDPTMDSEVANQIIEEILGIWIGYHKSLYTKEIQHERDFVWEGDDDYQGDGGVYYIDEKNIRRL